MQLNRTILSGSLFQTSSKVPHTFFLFLEESSDTLLFPRLSHSAAVTSSSSSSGIRLYLVPPGCMKHSLAKWPAKECLKEQSPSTLTHSYFVQLHFIHPKCQQPPFLLVATIQQSRMYIFLSRYLYYFSMPWLKKDENKCKVHHFGKTSQSKAKTLFMNREVRART